MASRTRYGLFFGVYSTDINILVYNWFSMTADGSNSWCPRADRVGHLLQPPINRERLLVKPTAVLAAVSTHIVTIKLITLMPDIT